MNDSIILKFVAELKEEIKQEIKEAILLETKANPNIDLVQTIRREIAKDKIMDKRLAARLTNPGYDNREGGKI